MQRFNFSRKYAVTLLFAILSVAVFSLTSAAAIQNGELPTRDEVQNQLNALNNKRNLTGMEKLVQGDLTETLETLDNIERVKQDTGQLCRRINQAPAEIAKATAGFSEHSKSNDDSDAVQRYGAMPLHDLEARFEETMDKLQDAQSELALLNSQLVSLQTQPERVQNVMLSLATKLQAVRDRINGIDADAQALRPSQQNMLLAQRVLLKAQLDQQHKRLKSNTLLQDCLQKQRDSANASISQLEHQLHLMQTAISNKRLNLMEETVRRAVSPDKTTCIQNNPLVKQELELNQQLSERLISATQNDNALVERDIKVQCWLERALQSERNLKGQIAMLKGSLLLSRILYQQQALPSANELEDMTTRIADLRLEQFDVNQQRDQLFQGDYWLAKMEEGHQSEMTPDVHNALLEIITLRRELLDQLNIKLGYQLMMAINLQINQQQLLSVSQSLKKMLSQQIFWINSNKPMSQEWGKTLPGALHSQIKAIRVTVNRKKTWNEIALAFCSGLPLLALAGLIRWRFTWMRHYLVRLAREVGQLRRDSQLHTPKAILINFLRTLPVCMIILAMGLIVRALDLNISKLLWAFSKELALFWLIFGLCWKVLEKDGMAVSHFTMPAHLTSHWRRQIVRISLALLPLLFWSMLAGLSPLHLLDDVLGQSVIFLNLLVIVALIWPMCRDSWRDKESHTVRWVTITTLSVVPVVLLVLTATGYFYTALRLAGRWIDTIYLVIIWNLLYQTVLHGLSVAARRMAWRRAIARRQNQVKEGAEGVEPLEEPPLALDQINQQTLRLVTLSMFALFGVVFWAIWSDLIGVLAWLDSMVLWSYSATEAGGAVVKSVTMGSLLFAVLVFIVAWLLIRNLPGLLEVLILSRLNMRQGASYAITTILNYVIIAVGAMTMLSALGVSWDKLQWLAAALSVGLGFGLQEIFGNFVSGLIILFERPVRIGDTVTIGTWSGTVSKIRIRATTITDFDRKEVIIPNKAFVTERLINWSLSDTVTRLVIRLGVAYGSNLDTVKAILLKAAMEHPKVLHEPGPTVLFTTFGASSLEHELRLFVREVRDRSSTVDELNRCIDRLFRENNIDIAFNQLEVHLRNDKGDEHTEVKRDINNDNNGSATVS